ncbi:hypothetical protein D3C73_674920 [compost metagenome]
MIVEKFRCQGQRRCCTFEVIIFQHPVLIHVSSRNAVRHVSCFGSDIDVVIRGKSIAIDHILPIGIGRPQQLFHDIGSICIDIVPNLIGSQQIYLFAHGSQGVLCRKIDLRTRSTPFFCGDQDNTIRRTRTIDGCSVSIFQDGKCLDVIGVDQA